MLQQIQWDQVFWHLCLRNYVKIQRSTKIMKKNLKIEKKTKREKNKNWKICKNSSKVHTFSKFISRRCNGLITFQTFLNILHFEQKCVRSIAMNRATEIVFALPHSKSSIQIIYTFLWLILYHLNVITLNENKANLFSLFQRAFVCPISVRLTLSSLCSSHILTHSETSAVLTFTLFSWNKDT